jgi:YfiH family protein
VEDLHRHHPVHRRLGCFVDGPHPAGADLLQDLELAVEDVAANVRVRRGHGPGENSTLVRRIVYLREVPMESPAQAQAQARHSALLVRAGFEHAFFTRNGGVSEPPFDTLSFAVNVGDRPEHVAENMARAAKLLGVDAAKLYLVSQVHGVVAHELRGDEDAANVRQRVGDVTMSRAPGVACGVRSADCVPILVGDRATGAVAAVHSGWRGTVAGAAGAGVTALRSLVGGRGDLVAAIGPHIEPCCFEVGEDVASSLSSCSNAGESAVDRGRGAKPHVDLRRIVRAQLVAAGVDDDAIDDVAGCTVCEAAHFHSFRRDGARSGRLLSAIVASTR